MTNLIGTTDKYTYYLIPRFGRLCVAQEVTKMKKQRFVLTYTGRGAMPPGQCTSAQLRERMSILEQNHQSLLVEAIPERLSRLLRRMPQWRVWSERSYNLLQRMGGFPEKTNYARLGLLMLATGLFLYLPISCQG